MKQHGRVRFTSSASSCHWDLSIIKDQLNVSHTDQAAGHLRGGPQVCAVRVETGRVGLWMDPDVLGLLGGEGREHTWLGDPGEWG